jgi:hypothetical protein
MRPNCGTCGKDSAQRYHCGGPSYCDHGIGLQRECPECHASKVEETGASYQWFCHCGWLSEQVSAHE